MEVLGKHLEDYINKRSKKSDCSDVLTVIKENLEDAEIFFKSA